MKLEVMFFLKTVEVFKTGVITKLFCPKCTTSLNGCLSLSRGHNIVKSVHSPAINFATGPSGRDLRLNSTFLSDLSSALKCRPFTRTLAASARQGPRGSAVLVQPPTARTTLVVVQSAEASRTRPGLANGK